MAELEHAARKRIDYWLGRARHELDLSSKRLPVPEVVFDLSGRAAGQAVLARRQRAADRIRINTALLASHPDAMLEETVPHEVAHVAVHRGYSSRVKPHGAEWRALMRAFGVPARACHNLPATPARRLRRFAYRCACNETAWLTTIRHRRALRGERYYCRHCGVELTRAPLAV